MILEGIMKATLIVKIVIFILISSSIISWALIIYNLINFKKIEDKDAEFIDFFLSSETKDFLRSYSKYDSFLPSPIAKMTQEVAAAISSKKEIFKERISRIIEQEAKNVINEISKFQFIYATVASSAPFIGLFGTVWGIMHSFHQIGKLGKVGLEVVAPGISEALFTTAMGLLAAIPSVIAYNFFQNKIKKISARIEFFSNELENLLINSFESSKNPDQQKNVSDRK